MTTTNDQDPSLWELLGLDRQTTVPPLPEEAWDRAVQIATDPDTPPVGADLIPADDPDELEIEPVAADVDLDVPDHDGHDGPIPDVLDDAEHDPGFTDHSIVDLPHDPYGHDSGIADDLGLG